MACGDSCFFPTKQNAFLQKFNSENGNDKARGSYCTLHRTSVQGDRQILLVYEIVCGEHLITAACKVRLNRRVPRKAQRGEPAAGEDLELKLGLRLGQGRGQG